jgi:hypothetical protein
MYMVKRGEVEFPKGWGKERPIQLLSGGWRSQLKVLEKK